VRVGEYQSDTAARANLLAKVGSSSGYSALSKRPRSFSHTLGRLDYRWIPVDWLLHERFDTLNKIGRLDLPMVVVHGTADDEVPPAMTERLYRAARGDKQLVMVKGADTRKQCRPAEGRC
jgi:fermentation-respiration switch protein FrsA (DUF1100 family)